MFCATQANFCSFALQHEGSAVKKDKENTGVHLFDTTTENSKEETREEVVSR